MSIFEIFDNDYLHKKSVKIFNAGHSAFKKGDYPDALNKFLKALEILEKANIHQPQKDELIISNLIVIAQVRGKMEQFELAELALSRALELNSNDISIYWGIGALKLDQNQFEEGIPLFEKMIELDPSDANGHFFKGVCLLELKKYKEAISDFKEALEIDSHSDDNTALSGTFACLGSSYAGLNELSKAIECYDQAIALDDKNSSAFVNRGNCKIDLGLEKEACGDYYRALELGDIRVQENIDEYCNKSQIPN
jgi:tetratricopeptide (TPR) repeat protein